MANDNEHDERWKQALQHSWLVRQIERRNPENAIIRRWFRLADRVTGHQDESENPEK